MTRPDNAELKRLAEVVSNDEIVRVHGHANFGPTITPRDVVNEGVLKYAIGFHSGSTQLSILLEHGLITKPRPGSYDASLTKKGKKYARALHNAGINLRSFRTQAPDSWRPDRDAINAAIEDADKRLAYGMELVKLVDGDHTYSLKIDGQTLFFTDSETEDWNAQDRLYTYIHEAKNRIRADTVIAALRPQTAESGK